MQDSVSFGVVSSEKRSKPQVESLLLEQKDLREVACRQMGLVQQEIELRNKLQESIPYVEYLDTLQSTTYHFRSKPATHIAGEGLSDDEGKYAVHGVSHMRRRWGRRSYL